MGVGESVGRRPPTPALPPHGVGRGNTDSGHRRRSAGVNPTSAERATRRVDFRKTGDWSESGTSDCGPRGSHSGQSPVGKYREGNPRAIPCRSTGSRVATPDKRESCVTFRPENLPGFETSRCTHSHTTRHPNDDIDRLCLPRRFVSFSNLAKRLGDETNCFSVSYAPVDPIPVG